MHLLLLLMFAFYYIFIYFCVCVFVLMWGWDFIRHGAHVDVTEKSLESVLSFQHTDPTDATQNAKSLSLPREPSYWSCCFSMLVGPEK